MRRERVPAAHPSMGQVDVLRVHERNHIRKAAYILYGSIYVTFERKQINGCKRLRVQGGAGYKGTFPWGKFGEEMEMF